MLLALLLIAQGQFFGPNCKQGQDCNLANVSLTGGQTFNTPNSTNQMCSAPLSGFAYRWFRTNAVYGVYEATNCTGGAVQVWAIDPSNKTFSVGSTYSLTMIPPATLPTCDSAHSGSFSTVNAGTGVNLFFCDGVQTSWVRVPVFGASSSGNPGLANITSRTTASGVITTGNALLGSGELNFSSSSTGVAGTLKISDAIRTQCATAGTGAGNMLVNFRKLTGGATTICTVNYPCAAAALTPQIASCTATITGVIGSFATDSWGTTLDVSSCTTNPADCVVNHSITSN